MTYTEQIGCSVESRTDVDRLEKYGDDREPCCQLRISHNILDKKGKHRSEDESNDVEEKFWASSRAVAQAKYVEVGGGTLGYISEAGEDISWDPFRL